MPKMKTNSGAKKRFKITGSGKVKRNNSSKSHLLACKNAKRKRQLRKSSLVSESEERRVSRMMPYA
ncbi:MAG: 50S ribosomal protein L35 [Spirochaetota bacterium]